ncbi:hypothetical protein M0802_014395 [Mischocyttarus mexicanus]|nr:hypothetical protein M0802_014395 [Mischocyttarus mexicanus]
MITYKLKIRDIRKGQLSRGAMEEPRPGGTAFMITVSPAPGKYDFPSLSKGYSQGSAQPKCNGRASPWRNRLHDHGNLCASMSIVVIMRIIAASKGTMLRSLAVQYSGDVRKVLQPRDYHDFKEIDKIEIIHDAKGKRDI